jgi:hypothetical protein
MQLIQTAIENGNNDVQVINLAVYAKQALLKTEAKPNRKYPPGVEEITWLRVQPLLFDWIYLTILSFFFFSEWERLG